jgi:acetylornithine/succinyldiaminopimelate/putrescine aminotransferase
MVISPGDHGTTFGGNPLACALGCVVLSTIAKKSFLKQVRTNGAYLKKKLEALISSFPTIESVRGTGLLLGVRMKEDPAVIVDACRKAGLLVIKAGHNTIRFIPPLIVTRKDIDTAVAVFTKVLKGQFYIGNPG